MKTHIIAGTMARFINDEEHRTGLFIGGFSTGIGKTYDACYMMLDESIKNPNMKFIYMTEQRKNLPYKELHNIAKNDFGMSDEKFAHHVIKLESNVDSFCRNYKENMKPDIEKLFKDNGIDRRVFTSVVDRMNAYKRARKSPSDTDRLDMAKEKFAQSEDEFRSALRKILKPLKSAKARLRRIATDIEWEWIGKLYPAIHFDSIPIILMTDKKFLYTIDTIVTTPFTIWSETDLRKENEEEHSRLRDRVIVIDEFDTAKKDMLDTIIEDNDMISNALRAFRNLYLWLPHWSSLPARMIHESEWWGQKSFSIEERFRNLIEDSRAIRENHHTEYLHKLTEVDRNGGYVEPQGSSFMFRDYEPHTIGNAFTLKTDDQSRYNFILTGRGITSQASKISILFYKLNIFFNKFSKLVRDLSFNYRSNNDAADEDYKSLPNCVGSIIDAMDLDSDLAKYVKTKVIRNRLRSRRDRRIDLLEPTVYSRGFSYVSMRDSLSTQLQTHLSYTEYDTTPEFILRHMCEETKVIGLSATGEIDSPISNFSLSYLRDVGVHIHEFNDFEKNELTELIDSTRVGFIDGLSKVHTISLPVKPLYDRTNWEDLFDDEDVAENLYQKIGSSEDADYSGSRYVRAAYALDSFLSHDGIQSMLCFFSAHVKKSGVSNFNTDKLMSVYREVAKKNRTTLTVRWSDTDNEDIIYEASNSVSKALIIQIDGANFEKIEPEIKKLLSECNKIMVITAYQTLGAGQNLQYDIPSELTEELVWVMNEDNKTIFDHGKKDFDAIYLDNPTNVGVSVEYENKSSLDKYLFYAEYVDASGQIEIGDKRGQIGRAFNFCYSQNDRFHPKHFKETDIYCLAKARIVVQAIGRICRTGWKRRDVYIFYDPQLKNDGTFNLDKECYGRFSNHEFDELYKEIHQTTNLDPDFQTKLLISSAVRTSHSLVPLIDDLRFAIYGGEMNAIRKWEQWRDFALRNPTGSKDISKLTDFEKEAYIYGYVKAPAKTDKYWFTLKHDFDQNDTDGLEISFTQAGIKNNIGKPWYTVSSETARLDLMLKIDGVRNFLAEEGVPTEFEPNERIMCPPLFRNIYMGALGELVGKFILERDCGLSLDSMRPQNYEQFDFVLKNGVFIDMKNWNENMYEDEKKTTYILNQTVKKLDRCGGKKAYIINIITSSKYRSYISYNVKDKEIIVIPYLYSYDGINVRPNDAAFALLSKEECDD